MKFISSKQEGNIFIFGVPYDASTCFYPGTRFAPQKIRKMSYNLETFSPYTFLDLEDKNFLDLEDIEIDVIDPMNLFEKVYTFSKKYLKKFKKGILIGGDHSSPIGFVKAIKEKYNKLILIHFDAHADLRDTYLNSKYSHACFARRILDFDIPIIQFGIRSFARDEYENFYRGNPSFEYNELLFKNNVMFLKNWENLKKVIFLFKEQGYSFYISLDIDVLDPSFAPGTGTPEAGGIDSLSLFDFIKYLNTIKINLVGFDVVEVNPLLDTSNITSALASKIIREILLIM